MKARVLPLDSDEHRTAQELLPWFVSGTLGRAEAAQVARHVEACVRCQSDAAEIASLRSLPVDPAACGNVERGWSALLGRISNASAPERRRPAAARPPWTRTLQVTVALQAAVILVLVLALFWVTPRAEPYRALGAPASPAEADAVVVFEPEATNAQMRAALRVAEARIVGGPTLADAYLIHLDHPGPEALLRLRSHPGVLSVASLHGKD